MKKYSPFIQIFTLMVALFSFAENVSGQFVYLNPLPGSRYHNPQTTLAIKNGDLMDESSVRGKDWISINGSKSGEHRWTARLSDDRKTIVVKPERDFAYSETVTVTIDSKLKKVTGQKISGKSFTFQIRDEITPEQEEIYRNIDRDLYRNESGFDDASPSDVRDLDLDSLPPFTVTTNNNAAPGQIFYNNQDDFTVSTNCFNTIIENDGTVVWAQDNGIDGHDFKINYNGYLTFFHYSSYYWMIMDSNYNIIDSITAGNGYHIVTNPHDFTMYPDGHTFLLIANHVTMNMTPYGSQDTAAFVTGVIIQELDANKDVVWEWSGWDHFQITDADNHIVLANHIVDYVHSNAISRDNDGNLLLSSRHFSELTKIDHNTGNIIWRMGGENNQFTFVNDNIPKHFSYQHDLRRLANGNITLYNNGNYLQPQRSSAKEYQLDEVNKVATLVWYYEHPNVNGFPVYGPATGSVQRLPNGNTMIDWGSTSSQPDRPSFTEVDHNKNITWEMSFDQFGQKSYRVHKYVWKPCAPVNVAKVKVKKITSSTAKVSWDPVKNATSYDVQYRKIGNTTWKLKNSTVTNKTLKQLTPQTSYQYQLRTHCANGYASDWTPLDTFTTLPAKFTLAENDELAVLGIYPNPASDILIMAVALDQDQQILVSIYDLTGRLMLSHMEKASAGEQELKMDISSLPAGYYLARVSMGSVNQTMKFVKQ